MMAEDKEDEAVNPDVIDALLEVETDETEEETTGIQFDEFGAPEEE